MRIGINLLYLIPGVVGGTQTYASGLLHALASDNPGDELTVFVNGEAAEFSLPAAAHRVVAPISGRRRAVRYAWEQGMLPRQLRRYGVDVVHSLGYVGPFATHCPRVVGIHDVNYRGYPMPLLRREVLRFFVGRSARSADRVLTLSNFSKAQLVEHVRLPPERITVVPLAGPEPSTAEQPSRRSLEATYPLEGPYLLAFSSQLPHKNIPRLIESFLAIRDRVPHRLVLAGHLPWDRGQRETIDEAVSAGRIVALGYVPDGHVAPLMRHADLFVFPSLYEGFGLPALEAQAAGVAVACSSAAALPEVAGDGAEYFDPRSVVSMSGVILRCLQDTALRAGLAERGRTNAARFSWRETARLTRRVYERVIDARRVGATVGT